MPLLFKALAFLQRDLLLEFSYPLAFAWRWGGVLFSLVTFYFLGSLISPAASPYLAPYGGNYFAFVVIGLALTSFQGVALNSLSQGILYGMYTGTLEAMLMTPTSLPTVIFSSVLWHFLSASVEIFLYLAMGLLLFGLSLSQTNVPATLVLFGLTVFAFLPLGILSASFILLFKRGDPLTMAIGQLSILLGGAYYPLTVLPEWLQVVAQVLPFTHALEGLRQAVLNGQGLPRLASEITVLFGFGAALFPFSLWVFSRAVSQAKRLGTLGQF